MPAKSSSLKLGNARIKVAQVPLEKILLQDYYFFQSTRPHSIPKKGSALGMKQLTRVLPGGSDSFGEEVRSCIVIESGD